MSIIQGLLNTPSLVLYGSKNRLKTCERFVLLHPQIPMQGAQLTALLPFYWMRRLLPLYFFVIRVCFFLLSVYFLLAICCFFVWNTFKMFFSVVFYTFWTFLNASFVVTTDTFNIWLPLLAKFIHCIAVKNSPLKLYSRPKLNYSSHFSSCSQLCFFQYFYFTVKQEKDWPQKKKKRKMLKRSFSQMSRGLQNKVLLFQQII